MFSFFFFFPITVCIFKTHCVVILWCLDPGWMPESHQSHRITPLLSWTGEGEVRQEAPGLGSGQGDRSAVTATGKPGLAACSHAGFSTQPLSTDFVVFKSSCEPESILKTQSLVFNVVSVNTKLCLWRSDTMRLKCWCLLPMCDSFPLYLSRLNTDVELCQSLRRLLADEAVMSSLDPETRYLLIFIDLGF